MRAGKLMWTAEILLTALPNTAQDSAGQCSLGRCASEWQNQKVLAPVVSHKVGTEE